MLEIRFDKDNERRLAVRPVHREFLAQLAEDGTLVMAGPLADESGAIQVLRADSREALEAISPGIPTPSRTWSAG